MNNFKSQIKEINKKYKFALFLSVEIPTVEIEADDMEAAELEAIEQFKKSYPKIIVNADESYGRWFQEVTND